MTMEVVWVIVGLIVAVIVVATVLAQAQIARARKFVPDQYEWLLVLSREQWKSCAVLCSEMDTLKGTEMTLWSLAQSDLAKLVNEGLIEKRVREVSTDDVTLYIEEYRLSLTGMQWSRSNQPTRSDLSPVGA